MRELVGRRLRGSLPETHKPQVWVDRDQEQNAAWLLIECEAHGDETNPRNAPPCDDGGDLTATCEECGVTSLFAAGLGGTGQRGPKCYACLDLGEFDWPDDDFGDPEDA